MSLPFEAVGGGFSIGRFAGIPFKVNPSWFVIAILITLSTAGAYGFFLGIAFTILFFASILAHELGHALAARSYGIGTRDITLHMLGGVARIEKEPATPGQEFVVAAAGPAVSVLLSIVFFVLSILTSFAGIGADDVLFHLCFANGALAIFNLLPGLPLDGGRILKSLLWAQGGDKTRATLGAATGGVLLGTGFMVWGVASLLGILPSLGGPFLMIIMGWFIRSMAKQEARFAQMQGSGRAGNMGEILRNAAEMLRRQQERQRDARSAGQHGTHPGESTRPQRDDIEVVRYPDGREVHVPKR